MQKIFLYVTLIMLVMLPLFACQGGESFDTDNMQQTQIPVQDHDAPVVANTPNEAVVVPTHTSTPEIAEGVNENQLTIDPGELMACDVVFCSWDWPGWLERPIGLGYNRRIDYSYPYASTGLGEFEIHHGVEFLNRQGTPVIAARDGEVVFADFDADAGLGPYWGFYGNVVILRHPDLVINNGIVYTLYAHLSEIAVDVGDRVNTGDLIGEVGFTGAAIGPHLHFEVRVGTNDYDHTVNPAIWFAPLDEAEHTQKATLAGRILGQDGDPLLEFPLTLERLTEFGTIDAYYYPKTYYAGKVNSHPYFGENFAISDLPAGNYRLAFSANRLYEVFFTLEAGSFGFISIQLD